MNKKKVTLLLFLALVLVLGGAGSLYQQVGQELAPDVLATEALQKAQPEEPSSTPSQATEAPTNLAPDFTVYDQEGNEVHLSDYLGKPVVLNFWASWCGPCKMEMPDFNEMYLELGDEVQFLLVNMTDGSRETLEIASGFIANQGYAFPVVYDTRQDAAIAYGVYSLPTTYFIDANGCAIAQATGAIDEATLQRGIDLISGK